MTGTPGPRSPQTASMPASVRSRSAPVTRIEAWPSPDRTLRRRNEVENRRKGSRTDSRCTSSTTPMTTPRRPPPDDAAHDLAGCRAEALDGESAQDERRRRWRRSPVLLRDLAIAACFRERAAGDHVDVVGPEEVEVDEHQQRQEAAIVGVAEIPDLRPDAAASSRARRLTPSQPRRPAGSRAGVSWTPTALPRPPACDPVSTTI